MTTQLMLSNLMRKFHRHFKGTNYTEIEAYFKFSEKEKLYCGYCKKELQETAPYPHFFNPSIDHKQPLSRGGSNSFDNVEICCHRCNIVKGTMSEHTFRQLLKLIQVDSLICETIMTEMFLGRLADKLRREGLNKEPAKPKELFEYV